MRIESRSHLKQDHDVAGRTMPPKLSTSANLADVEELSDLNAQEWTAFLVSTTLNLAFECKLNPPGNHQGCRQRGQRRLGHRTSYSTLDAYVQLWTSTGLPRGRTKIAEAWFDPSQRKSRALEVGPDFECLKAGLVVVTGRQQQ